MNVVQDPRILEALRELGVQVPQDIDTIRAAPSFGEAQSRLAALKERIHKNFRKLAFELHPDRTGGDEAKTEHFKLLVQIKDGFDKVRLQQAPRPQHMVMHVRWQNPFAYQPTNAASSTSVYTAYYQGTTTGSPTAGPPLRVVVMKPF